MPTVLITGAAGTIGGATARVFHEAGWSLALLDHGPEAVEKLRAAYPDAFAAAADLTDEAATRSAVERAEAFAPIDAVLNIAGGFGMEAAAEATSASQQKMFALNFTTVFNTTRAALPAMLERGSGFVLGVSAEAAEKGGAGMALYAASKAATAIYLRSLDAELRSEGIRVSVLYPMGAVDTPANRESMPSGDPSTWVTPEELARTMLHAATRSRQGHLRDLHVYAG
jgi:NADP-dependent 3-hydroxy acid dehydrogenase YdfG